MQKFLKFYIESLKAKHKERLIFDDNIFFFDYIIKNPEIDIDITD